MKRSLALLSVFFVSLALAVPTSKPSAKAAAESAIRKLDEAWSKDAGKGSVDAFLAYYTKDALVLPPNEPVANTPAKIRKSIEGLMSLPGLKISWTVQKVVASDAGDLGYCHGKYKISFKGPDGKTIEDVGKTLSIWKKQKNGRFMCIVDTWSSDLPAGG